MRTIKVGGASTEDFRLAERLIRIQDDAIAVVAPGVHASVPDAIYRDGVLSAGLAERYTKQRPSTASACCLPPSGGEGPEASPAADWTFAASMTFHTYVLARDFGFSETILVTETGCERLTTCPRELIVAGTGACRHRGRRLDGNPALWRGDPGDGRQHVLHQPLPRPRHPPEDLRRLVENRRSLHDAAYLATGGVRGGYEAVTDKSQGPGARHPIVKVHSSTGRKALYLGRMGFGYIEGLTVEESDEALDALWAHMTRPEFVWEQVWRTGDLIIWDNRCVAHARGAFDPCVRRLMRRVAVMDD